MKTKSSLPTYGLRLLLAISPCAVALPAWAQDGYPSSGNLSDVTGPSLDNLGVSSRADVLLAAPPEIRTIGINTPLSVMMAQADTPGGTALLDNVIDFNRSMDKLLPFCGCSNVNWRAYNRTVQIATRLRGSLAASVGEQQKILASNPAPQQISGVQKRLQAIEATTTALENAVTILNRLGKALDKAR